ncbi:MAG TPA: GH25 family lysozyme [Mucilaginibacter sp.]|jgi:lysozyme|nr:GH25 family lysozyme [Mucilaginibacter sp.]
MNTLQNGSTGGEVIMLQRALSVLGYAIAIDGNFGPGTAAAVTQFQTTNSLTADGTAGPNTWGAIDSQAPQGMDISHNNGNITWDQLTPHIQFVFCKYSQGAAFKDPMFNSYISNIKQQSLMAGAYHFLDFQSSAQDQANNFLANGLNFSDKSNVLPPMLDVEWQVGSDDADTNNLNQYITDNKNACVQIVTDWLNIVSTQTGRTPIIYTAKSFWNEYFAGVTQFGGNPLWIASYQSQPPGMPNGWANYTIWQYSETGPLPGTSGDVDQDIFSGTIAALKSMP